MRANTLDAVAAAALAGGGLVYVPAWQVFEHLAGGRLGVVLRECELPPIPINAIVSHTKLLSAQVRLPRDTCSQRSTEAPVFKSEVDVEQASSSKNSLNRQIAVNLGNTVLAQKSPITGPTSSKSRAVHRKSRQHRTRNGIRPIRRSPGRTSVHFSDGLGWGKFGLKSEACSIADDTVCDVGHGPCGARLRSTRL
jgi:hypothetical protein